MNVHFNPDGSLNGLRFEANGRKFKLIASESQSKKAWDTLDTYIRDDGRIYTYSRKKWHELYINKK